MVKMMATSHTVFMTISQFIERKALTIHMLLFSEYIKAYNVIGILILP